MVPLDLVARWHVHAYVQEVDVTQYKDEMLTGRFHKGSIRISMVGKLADWHMDARKLMEDLPMVMSLETVQPRAEGHKGGYVSPFATDITDPAGGFSGILACFLWILCQSIGKSSP